MVVAPRKSSSRNAYSDPRWVFARSRASRAILAVLILGIKSPKEVRFQSCGFYNLTLCIRVR